MLDSSPIAPPPPPRKTLKRTASVASLPSPPPSVQPPKKRPSKSSQRSDSDIEEDDEGNGGGCGADEEEEEEREPNGNVLGCKVLFPVASGSTMKKGVLDDDDDENPFEVKTSRKPSNLLSSPLTPPTRGRNLPAIDESDNPFLVTSSPKKPTKTRRRTPINLTEQPTLTYVFKGIKTQVPNPHYGSTDSPFIRPMRLFPEAYANDLKEAQEDEDDGDETEEDELDNSADEMPKMSKIFVDEAGNPLPDSGPQGVRGKTMDAMDVGRMAVGPIRGRG